MFIIGLEVKVIKILRSLYCRSVFLDRVSADKVTPVGKKNVNAYLLHFCYEIFMHAWPQ